MFVKICKLGSAVKEVMLEDNATIDQALSAAAMVKDGCDLRVNGRTPCGNLRDGDVVTLVPAIKGGRG